MNPQFPVPLNENKLNESDVKEMPAWFKTPLDYINKIAETLFYAQEVNLEEEILSKVPSADVEGYLDSLGGSDGDMLSKISGGYDFTPPLDVESYLDSLGGSIGQALVKNSGGYDFENVGKILQVVSVTKTDTFSYSGSVGVFADITGLSATITPKSATSKIIILGSVSRGVSLNALTYFRVIRDATPILLGDSAGSRMRSTSTAYYGASGSDLHLSTISINGEDTPSSVTAITYKIQIATDGSGTHYVNRTGIDIDADYCSRNISTLILMEVGA